MIQICDLTWEEMIWLSRAVEGFQKEGYKIEKVTRLDGQLALVLEPVVLGETND